MYLKYVFFCIVMYSLIHSFLSLILYIGYQFLLYMDDDLRGRYLYLIQYQIVLILNRKKYCIAQDLLYQYCLTI